MRWTMENGLGLVFVVSPTHVNCSPPQVVFPALLPLAYIPALLQRTKQLFLALFQPYLESLVDTLNDRAGTITDASISAFRVLSEKIAEERWDKIFERCLKNAEAGSGRKTRVAAQRQLAVPVDQSGGSCEFA